VIKRFFCASNKPIQLVIYFKSNMETRRPTQSRLLPAAMFRRIIWSRWIRNSLGVFC